jgi:hypothetical protein
MFHQIKIFSNYLPLRPRRAAESKSAVRVSGDAEFRKLLAGKLLAAQMLA